MPMDGRVILVPKSHQELHVSRGLLTADYKTLYPLVAEAEE